METVTYSRIDSLETGLDIYLPPNLPAGPRPAIVHFHGRGMIGGCRKILLFQRWLLGNQ
jgi:acetyl esterase/lipase